MLNASMVRVNLSPSGDHYIVFLGKTPPPPGFTVHLSTQAYQWELASC